MMLRKALALVSCTTLMSSLAFANAPGDFSQAVAQIQGDSQLLAGWETDQLRYAIPFNSTAGNVVPSQLHLFGFEVGVEGVATSTKLDVDGLRALPTSIIDPHQIDTFSRLPLPSILGHAKVGLPFGIDAGVRIGGIPRESYNKDDTHVSVKNSIFGIDLRKKLIDEGALKPFGLTVGANFTHANGSADTTTPYSSQNTVNVNGTDYNSALSATGANHSKWDTKSWGLQMIADKQLLFFTPYVGASANRNFGSISSNIATNGTETLTNAGNSADTATQGFSTDATSGRGVNKWDVRALIGADFTFLPFFKLGIHGEYAGDKNMAADLGLRFQFP